MKYFSKSQIYKASNVTFDPKTKRAYSYGWWKFVDEINGMVVFNSYPYSTTTRKHQSKVRRLMDELGIEIDIEIECPVGLQSINAPDSVASHYDDMMKELEEKIKRGRREKNKERMKVMIDLITKKTIAQKTIYLGAG